MHLRSNLCAILAVAASCFVRSVESTSRGPFLEQLNSTSWIIGNDYWNMTQGPVDGKKLMYKGKDLVGIAEGHYVSYNGAASNLAWLNASIVHRSSNPEYIDVAFAAVEGDMHWIITPDLVGAYQYFVNRALPILGEFRTLWRLDNTTFTRGRTQMKDGLLPPLSEYAISEKVQDETWLTPGGTYLTKYDWSAFIKRADYWGVYGEEFGSWYIHAGKDYFNGDHLKQELMVHRESTTGDTVQLNMIHGTHYQASSSDSFPPGKVWGPWLWYLNNGSLPDAAAVARQERAAWPYPWFQNAAYHARGEVTGTLVLSDGRPAAGAAVFLGDNHPNKTALDMGGGYYYDTYADDTGAFRFADVRAGTYALQAWSAGGSLADVSTTHLLNDVVVAADGRTTSLPHRTWVVHDRDKEIFRIGAFDRTSLGFRYGGAPYQHALVDACPANLTYDTTTTTTVAAAAAASNTTSTWCFGQSKPGTWTVLFNLPASTITNTTANATAILTLSLAGYSQGTSIDISLNGRTPIGNLTSGDVPSDPCLYRSGTTAGEWHQYEFAFAADADTLRPGRNALDFVVVRNTTWRGPMWDAVALRWA